MRVSYGGVRGSLIAAGLAVFVSGAPLQAQQQQERREHTVKRGDTLWDLARTYLNNPFLWPLIFEANRQVVENSHWIYPKERLVIPPLPGEIRPAPPAEANLPASELVAPAEKASSNVRRTRFYSSENQGNLPTLVQETQPAARRVEAREFHASPWLAPLEGLPAVGSVYKPADPRTERDVLPTLFHPFDRLFVTFSGSARPRAGDLLLVVSVGREVPGYGRLIEPTGVIRVDSIQQNTMLAMVTHQFGSLSTGNLVLPMDSFPNVSGEAVSIADGPRGDLIDFLVPQPVVSIHDFGFVSVGGRSGIRVGDEFAAVLPARQPGRKAEPLPAQQIARLLVTRVTESSATVRVIHLDNPALRSGLPVRLIARMP